MFFRPFCSFSTRMIDCQSAQPLINQHNVHLFFPACCYDSCNGDRLVCGLREYQSADNCYWKGPTFERMLCGGFHPGYHSGFSLCVAYTKTNREQAANSIIVMMTVEKSNKISLLWCGSQVPLETCYYYSWRKVTTEVLSLVDYAAECARYAKQTCKTTTGRGLCEH